ncbi:MAG: tyrosine--tRNA ligase [Gemmatimonadota bacterium]
MRNLFDQLKSRGFLQDSTPGVEERLAAGPITGYIGFDPTSDSLHVGSLVVVMGLSWLQRSGGTPIPLVGGGTGMVGDPSGKRTERPVLTLEEIDGNVDGMRRQLSSFLDFEGANAARMLNNADWLRAITLMDFLRDTGKHFTLNYMQQKESVRSRMESGISFTEFSYMLVQAYDFWHLFKAEDCELQMGGSDQWGNITAGIELISRREQKSAHGIVFPLLTTSAGGKFGKSEDGNIWLDPEKTSPYKFYQFWLNSDDRDVDRYLKLFTFLPLETIEEIVMVHREEPGKRHAQRVLADDVTARVHGRETTDRVVEASKALFSGSSTDLPIDLLPEMPECVIPRQVFGEGMAFVDVLVASGLASSKSDARRGISGKGFYLNGQVVAEAERLVTEQDLQDGGGKAVATLRKGKKNYVKLVVQ